MGQTIGSQLLGQWYDVAGWGLISAIFVYLSVSSGTLPPHVKERMPMFLLNKRNCAVIAMCMAGMGIYKAMAQNTYYQTQTPISKAALNESPHANLSMSPLVIERQWLKIDSNAKGDALFIDPGSVLRTGKRVEYWNRVTFAEPRNVGSTIPAYAILDRSVADCDNTTIANVQSLAISKTGQPFNVAYRAREEQVFMPIPSDPKHPDVILFRYVCPR